MTNGSADENGDRLQIKETFNRAAQAEPRQQETAHVDPVSEQAAPGAETVHEAVAQTVNGRIPTADQQTKIDAEEARRKRMRQEQEARSLGGQGTYGDVSRHENDRLRVERDQRAREATPQFKPVPPGGGSDHNDLDEALRRLKEADARHQDHTNRREQMRGNLKQQFFSASRE